MSKRLLLKSVLFVSTVAPVMVCAATTNTNQNPEMFTQETQPKKQLPNSENPINTQNLKGNADKNTNQNAFPRPSRPEESEEMD